MNHSGIIVYSVTESFYKIQINEYLLTFMLVTNFLLIYGNKNWSNLVCPYISSINYKI